MTSSTLRDQPWPHQSWTLICARMGWQQALKKNSPTIRRQEQCICNVAIPAILSLRCRSPVPPPRSPSGQWSSWFLSSPSHNVHPRRLRILIKHLSNEADYHIYPTHPSCPTNGHKNRGRIPAPALTTTFRLPQAVFLLLPLYMSQSLYEKLSKDPPPQKGGL